MTQPGTATQQPDQFPTGTVVTVAVIGLALLAVETRVREEVAEDIETALAAFAVLLLAVLASPGVTISTGVELMSRAKVHAGLVKTINASKLKVAASVRAGYLAAAHVALTKTTADLRRSGYAVPATLPELYPTAERIGRDVDAMFGHAQSDLVNTVIAAFDGVQGPDADAARTLTVDAAVAVAKARLQQRAAAAAGTAVNQGSRDAQQGIWAQYQNITGVKNLMKRWHVTSAEPCGMCDALDGTMVGVNAEFDHSATTKDADLRPIWMNLLGPPRHPNCRCQLELVTS